VDGGRLSVTIPNDLVDFLTSGVSVLVGTRDAQLRPEATRAYAPVVSLDRRRLDVIVPRGPGDRTLANIEDNGQVAVSFTRALDHISVQVKGTCVGTRPTTEADRVPVERYRAAFVEGLYLVGMRRSLTSRLRALPGVVITVEVSSVFNQTPGPGAGRPVEAT
jgi:hypothetical protein